MNITDNFCPPKSNRVAAYLHQHVLVLRVLTVVRLPAQLLHLHHQAPVAHDLQQAGLQRDAQPGDTRGEGGLLGRGKSDPPIQLAALCEPWASY